MAKATVNIIDKVTKISVGDSHSLAVTSNGDVYGWGLSTHSELGLDYNIDTFSTNKNDKKYVIPLSSAKEKHKTQKNDVDFTRIFDGEKLISVLNFNNMIPVDDRFITKIDLRPSLKDISAHANYKKLCIKEIEWCRKNKEAIVKKANKLYYLVQKPNCSSMLKKRCNDFKKLEKVLEKLLQKK